MQNNHIITIFTMPAFKPVVGVNSLYHDPQGRGVLIWFDMADDALVSVGVACSEFETAMLVEDAAGDAYFVPIELAPEGARVLGFRKEEIATNTVMIFDDLFPAVGGANA